MFSSLVVLGYKDFGLNVRLSVVTELVSPQALCAWDLNGENGSS